VAERCGRETGPRMSAKATNRFPRTARLLRHADFERVYKLGRRHFSSSMTVFYLLRPQEEAQQKSGAAQRGLRVGFTVARALGGAVQRNRMKRRLREAVRLSLLAESAPVDVVINPKKLVLTAEFAAIVNEVRRAFVVIEERCAVKPAQRENGKVPGAQSLEPRS
jgi:ribonuclease P protein component